MHNLIEYSDNYSDSSGSLCQFKRDEIEGNANLTVANSSSFKYKSDFVTDKKVNRTISGVKIAIKIKIKIPLKYLSNFWRSLETLEIKMGCRLKWAGKCILATPVDTANDPIANAVSATFKLTDAKLYVPVVTLSTEDCAKLSKQLSEGSKRPVYCNEYKVIEKRSYNAGASIRELLDCSY